MVAMTNRMRLVVVVSALALAAGLLTLALLAKPTQAQAQTETFNERFAFEFVAFNPCTGEEFFAEGTSHVVFHITQDPSGGSHVKSHLDSHGQGVSESGAKYVLHDTTNGQNNFRLFAQENFTATETFKTIRQGEATPEDDFLTHVVFHYTFNANGELTSEVVKVEVECK